MSVSLLLIPGALAIVGAVGGVGAFGVSTQLRAERDARAGGADPGESTATELTETAVPAQLPVQVRTRMKDTALLAAALEDLGATELAASEDSVAASIGALQLTMTRDTEGIWEAHIESASEAEAAALIDTLDARYALRVQQAVAERIRQRAEGAGFGLISETRAADNSVTMVLEVREGNL